MQSNWHCIVSAKILNLKTEKNNKIKINPTRRKRTDSALVTNFDILVDYSGLKYCLAPVWTAELETAASSTLSDWVYLTFSFDFPNKLFANHRNESSQESVRNSKQENKVDIIDT